MTCDAGDVVLVWFPESNLQVVNRRPALVVMVNDRGDDHHEHGAGRTSKPGGVHAVNARSAGDGFAE